jgi:hypothetical protein
MEAGIVKPILFDLLENTPMLVSGGRQTRNSQNDKTQPENEGAVHMFQRASSPSGPFEKVSKLGNAKPETDKGKGRADPGHQGPVSRLPASLSGQFVG